ncbi:UNVERIFIED_CONTAM: hypothetical protein H355_004411, partial [Colinus virginianus]
IPPHHLTTVRVNGDYLLKVVATPLDRARPHREATSMVYRHVKFKNDLVNGNITIYRVHRQEAANPVDRTHIPLELANTVDKDYHLMEAAIMVDKPHLSQEAASMEGRVHFPQVAAIMEDRVFHQEAANPVDRVDVIVLVGVQDFLTQESVGRAHHILEADNMVNQDPQEALILGSSNRLPQGVVKW